MTRTTHRALGGMMLMLGTAAAAAPAAGQAAGDKVTVQTVSYDELGKAIRGLKGKVVVVDFWATT